MKPATRYKQNFSSILDYFKMFDSMLVQKNSIDHKRQLSIWTSQLLFFSWHTEHDTRSATTQERPPIGGIRRNATSIKILKRSRLFRGPTEEQTNILWAQSVANPSTEWFSCIFLPLTAKCSQCYGIHSFPHTRIDIAQQAAFFDRHCLMPMLAIKGAQLLIIKAPMHFGQLFAK